MPRNTTKFKRLCQRCEAAELTAGEVGFCGTCAGEMERIKAEIFHGRFDPLVCQQKMVFVSDDCKEGGEEVAGSGPVSVQVPPLSGLARFECGCKKGEHPATVAQAEDVHRHAEQPATAEGAAGVWVRRQGGKP